MKSIKFLVVIILGLCINGCQKKETKPLKKRAMVSVSILPYKYFVKRLGGDLVDVNLMVKPGQSPATYEPSPDQMKALSNSLIYFEIHHLGFEKSWMSRLVNLNKKMKVVDCSKGIELIKGEACSHGHHHEGDHDHGGVDPHIWLSVKDVMIQVAHIRDGLVDILPEHKVEIEKNYETFIKEAEELKAFMDLKLKPLQKKSFLVYHPAWSYLARDYGMVQHSLEVDGKKPDPGDLKNIIDIANKYGINSIVIQSQFDRSVAEKVASEIGGEVVLLDPLAEEWFENMRYIAVKLSEVLVNVK